MWIYSRPRNEHENRFLLNLDQSSRINLTQLGERWFLEVMLGAESVPVASTHSQEEAAALLQQVFESLHAGEKALDLGESAEKGEHKEASDLANGEARSPA